MQPANGSTEHQGLRVPLAASVPPREPPHLPNAISRRGVVNTCLTDAVTLTFEKRSLECTAANTMNGDKAISMLCGRPGKHKRNTKSYLYLYHDVLYIGLSLPYLYDCKFSMYAHYNNAQLFYAVEGLAYIHCMYVYHTSPHCLSWFLGRFLSHALTSPQHAASSQPEIYATYQCGVCGKCPQSVRIG